MTDDPRPEHRIAKLLARAGVASRREIERMIADGRVALDGKVLDTPATLLRSLRGVTVDGTPVEAPEPARLFVYHKPPGLLVTEHDPAGRPTIYDRLPADLPRVVPVGRLDLATEGLLLLTTDGGLKRTLELPATGVERAYRARAYGEISQARLEELIEGVEIDGMRYGPIDANLERRTGANVWIELILTEGKNREVRRVLDHLDLQVSRLIRTRYGPFVLGDLPAGGVGEVRQHDLVAFTRSLRDGRPSDVRVEAVEPRTAARSTRVASPRAPADPASPASDGAHTPRRAPGDAPASRAGPSATPRPGFRAAPAATGTRSARSAAFADRISRERAEDGTARPPRPLAAQNGGRSPRGIVPAGRPQRPRDDGSRDDAMEARPGRTGPRAARPARASREDARVGSKGGWPDRAAPGERARSPSKSSGGNRTGPGKPRSRPGTPGRPDDGTRPGRGPGRGKR